MSPDTGTSVAVNIAYLKTDVFGGHEAGNIEMGGGTGATAAGPPPTAYKLNKQGDNIQP